MLEQIDILWNEALDVWSKGGWAMYGIALIAMVIFGLGMHVHLRLRVKRDRSVTEEEWRRWIHRPGERRGPIGKVLDFVTGGTSIEQMAFFFGQLRTAEVMPFERDLRVMKICVSAAPLVGLLGTVTGMLSTFSGLAAGSGGDKTMSLVAAGISEALITTETGLVIALPGLFFQYRLTRILDRYKAFLAHLETVCTQTLYLRKRTEKRVEARKAAFDTIAKRLRQAVS